MFFRILFFLTALFVAGCSTQPVTTLCCGAYTMAYDKATGYARIYYNDTLLFDKLHAEYRMDNVIISSLSYTSRKAEILPATDPEGNFIFEIKHTAKGLPDMLQRFYFSPSNPYILTEIELHSDTAISSNYMAPVIACTSSKSSDKMLFIPFDNDKWIQFDLLPAGNGTSYEVTALFSPDTRAGKVVGSVEHDCWKSAVQTEKLDQKRLLLKCFGGITSSLTRDTLPHGKLTGNILQSPKILLGGFSDWRRGMEIFAQANRQECPGPTWEKEIPFGWNSWGSIQQKINLENATEVSDFFKKELQATTLKETPIYIGLDSYWDNFSDEELAQFVAHCQKNGQEAGIYWAPFVDWARNPRRIVEGSDTPYADTYLYAHGQPQELDGAWAVDPTHPAIKKRMDFYINRFKKAGFSYIKIDFLTHGALEADSHADSTVTTGIQAYNAGMRYLTELLGDDFYITMAISPLFPANYAHSRRIACDAFASIADTEYTLNGLSFGWWLGHCYAFNDPDHLVLQKNGESEGENRARITSGVITGILMSGDDVSQKGSLLTKERVKRFFADRQIIALARKRLSFYPVYGYLPSEGRRAERIFISSDQDSVYLAVFNFDKEQQTIKLPISDLELPAGERFRFDELWRQESGLISNDTLSFHLPGKDAAIFRIIR